MTLLPDHLPEPYRTAVAQAEDCLKRDDPHGAVARCAGVLRGLAGGPDDLGACVARLADELHGPGGWPQPAVALRSEAASYDPAAEQLPSKTFAENLVNFTVAALGKRYAVPGQPALAPPPADPRDG